MGGSIGSVQRKLGHAHSFMKEINPSRVGISAGVRIYPGTRLADIALADFHKGNVNLRGEVNHAFFALVIYVSNAFGDEIYLFIASGKKRREILLRRRGGN